MAEDRVISITNLKFLCDRKNKFLSKDLVPISPESTPVPEFLTKDKFISLDSIKFKPYEGQKLELIEKGKDEHLEFTTFEDYICIRIPSKIVKEITKYSKKYENIYISFDVDDNCLVNNYFH